MKKYTITDFSDLVTHH